MFGLFCLVGARQRARRFAPGSSVFRKAPLFFRKYSFVAKVLCRMVLHCAVQQLIPGSDVATRFRG